MKKAIMAALVAVVLAAPAVQAKNPTAVDTRVNGVCGSMAQTASIANPDAVFQQCWYGARDAYRGKAGKCEKNLAAFRNEAEKMHGMARGEYNELGRAYKAGCNIGQSSKDAGY